MCGRGWMLVLVMVLVLVLGPFVGALPLWWLFGVYADGTHRVSLSPSAVGGSAFDLAWDDGRRGSGTYDPASSTGTMQLSSGAFPFVFTSNLQILFQGGVTGSPPGVSYYWDYQHELPATPAPPTGQPLPSPSLSNYQVTIGAAILGSYLVPAGSVCVGSTSLAGLEGQCTVPANNVTMRVCDADPACGAVICDTQRRDCQLRYYPLTPINSASTWASYVSYIKPQPTNAPSASTTTGAPTGGGAPTPTPTGAPTGAGTPATTGAPTATGAPTPTGTPTATGGPTGQPCSAISSTDCGPDGYCDEVSFNSRCHASLSLGSVCPNVFFSANQARVCGPNGYCQVASSLDSTGTCVSRGTSGAACQTDNPLACVQGMLCLHTTNKCSNPLPQGATCSWNADCASGFCGPLSTCIAPPTGIPSDLPSGLPSGLPTLPNMPTKAPGSTINATCSPTSIFDPCDPITYCNEDRRRCELSLGVNASCVAFFSGTEAKVCGSTGYCKKAAKLDSTGVCALRATTGQTCDINVQASCISGNICAIDPINAKGPVCIDINQNIPVGQAHKQQTVVGVWCLVVLIVSLFGMM